MLRCLLDLVILMLGLKTSAELIVVRFMGDVVSYRSQCIVGATVALSPDHRERESPSAMFIRNK